MTRFVSVLFCTFIFFSAVCCFSALTIAADNISVSTVKTPAVHIDGKMVQNPFYPGSREPLQPFHFQKLPVGAVQPGGWLGETFRRQCEGLCGHLGSISRWLDKEDNAWLTTGGKHGWEEVPYWLRGYASMAFISKDEKMLAETMVWIEAVFKSQRADGWFGPETRKKGCLDIWSNMIILFTLQDYYEFSGDKRVLDLMRKYFAFLQNIPETEFLKDYWENCRQGDNMYSVLWFYNITGEKEVLPLVKKLHDCGADWCRISDLPNWHNVNVAQGFREPATYFLLTGNNADIQASYDNHHLIRRTFGQVPGGMFGSDENSRLGRIDPRQGVETCGIVEQMTSDEIMLRITGDDFWAENCEDVLFNSFHSAFMPDMRSLHYVTSPNMVLCDGANHAPGIQNRGPFLIMNPFSSRCCQHNHGFGIPYYIQNLWLAAPDKGLAVALYNASTVHAKVGTEGTEVTVNEETHYPFNETIQFTLQTPKQVSFPLYLRIPSWCKTKPELQLNGKSVSAGQWKPGSYIRIERDWSNNDKLELKLPMEISIRTWQVNQNSVSVNYGPLTFSLKIKERYHKVSSTETAIGDSAWQKNADQAAWPSFEIFPDSPWNYGLVVNSGDLSQSFKLVRKAFPKDNFPFTADAAPLAIEAKGRRIPSWKIDQYGLCGILPPSPTHTEEPVEDIQLLPMGAVRLRISAFPVVEEAEPHKK
jgi:DUF1680 family protein